MNKYMANYIYKYKLIHIVADMYGLNNTQREWCRVHFPVLTKKDFLICSMSLKNVIKKNFFVEIKKVMSECGKNFDFTSFS